ncbi:MAG: hypothetical protein CMN76_19525 [Spirochaetaceae bacterium]|nr:hypothetical protein [Spirochaetaceae bacterium]
MFLVAGFKPGKHLEIPGPVERGVDGYLEPVSAGRGSLVVRNPGAWPAITCVARPGKESP